MLCIHRGDCCTDLCLSRRRDTENDIQQLRWDLQNKDDKIRQLEKETQVTDCFKIVDCVNLKAVLDLAAVSLK